MQPTANLNVNMKNDKGDMDVDQQDGPQPAHGGEPKRRRKEEDVVDMSNDEAKNRGQDTDDKEEDKHEPEAHEGKLERERNEECSGSGVIVENNEEKIQKKDMEEREGAVDNKLPHEPAHGGKSNKKPRVGLCAVDAALVSDATRHLEDRFECQDVALDNPGETDDLDIILILVPVRAHACSFFSFDGSLKEWKETVNGWKNVHVVMIPQSSNAEDFHKTTKTLTNIWGERWNWLIYHRFPSLTHCYLLNSAIDEPSPENNASTRGGLLQIDGMAELQR